MRRGEQPWVFQELAEAFAAHPVAAVGIANRMFRIIRSVQFPAADQALVHLPSSWLEPEAGFAGEAKVERDATTGLMDDDIARFPLGLSPQQTARSIQNALYPIAS